MCALSYGLVQLLRVCGTPVPSWLVEVEAQMQLFLVMMGAEVTPWPASVRAIGDFLRLKLLDNTLVSDVQSRIVVHTVKHTVALPIRET